MSHHDARSLPERGHEQLRASDAEHEQQQLRASDADREQAAGALREHATAGRLTMEELDERAQAAFAARTRQDLESLFEDLPAERRDHSAARLRAKRRAHSAHVRAYVLVSLGLVAIWVLSGAGYFWPVWPIMGWGIGVASHTAGWRTVCSRARRASSSPIGLTTRPPTTW
jgi:Domain of unknown function (DUF1707)/2TM domain